MFTSPQSLTINTVTSNYHQVTDDAISTTYRTQDGTLEFKVSHQVTAKRARRMARLDQTKVAADPLTAVNTYQKAGVYIVFDEPSFGFTDAEVEDLVEALKTWLTSANITAMLAGRH